MRGRVKPAWGDVPYHFYIAYDGQIAEGRALGFQGDTNTNYSLLNKIQVVLEGDFRVEHLREAQIRSLNAIVCWLRKTYTIPLASLHGHQDLASTSCPGKHLMQHISAMRSKRFR